MNRRVKRVGLGFALLLLLGMRIIRHGVKADGQADVAAVVGCARTLTPRTAGRR